MKLFIEILVFDLVLLVLKWIRSRASKFADLRCEKLRARISPTRGRKLIRLTNILFMGLSLNHIVD